MTDDFRAACVSLAAPWLTYHELKEIEEKLKHMAATDELTGLANRRSFNEHLEWSIHNSKRNSEILSLVLIDIDHFKKVNDTYGHQFGDNVLRAVGAAIMNACRKNDYPARFGGEEFIVVLHNTDAKQSLLVAERLREHIAVLMSLRIR